MARAWPFENEPEGPPERIATPHRFVQKHAGTEAVIVRIGLNGAQLVLVAESGAWDKWVYPSVEAAQEAAEDLGIVAHIGEYPEQIRVRMNSWVRPADDYDRAAYPEQGVVGPVIPYPENRPRREETARSAAHDESESPS